jgi:hypothetical protein
MASALIVVVINVAMIAKAVGMTRIAMNVNGATATVNARRARGVVIALTVMAVGKHNAQLWFL